MTDIDLKTVMAAVNDMNKSHGVTQRGGKKYTEVAKRIEVFRAHFGIDYGFNTEILVDDGQRVVVRASIKHFSGFVISQGVAEEIRGSSNVNTTSALENCETSAWGRALAAIGLHGGQIASINEIETAKRNQQAIASQPTPEPAGPEPDIALDEIQKIPTQTGLTSWVNDNQAYLDSLSQTDKQNFQKILNAYNNRKEQLNAA